MSKGDAAQKASSLRASDCFSNVASICIFTCILEHHSHHMMLSNCSTAGLIGHPLIISSDVSFDMLSGPWDVAAAHEYAFKLSYGLACNFAAHLASGSACDGRCCWMS